MPSVTATGRAVVCMFHLLKYRAGNNRLRNGLIRRGWVCIPILIIILLSASESVAAQSEIGTASWATTGNTFVFSASGTLSYTDESVPNGRAGYNSAGSNITLVVGTVAGDNISMEEKVHGLGPYPSTLDPNSTWPQNPLSLHFYIPPGHLQATLLASPIDSAVALIPFPFDNSTVIQMVSEGPVRTSFGDVDAWTLAVNVNGSGRFNYPGVGDFTGDGSLSLSYDSQLGLLLAMYVIVSGTTKNPSGPASYSNSLSLTSKPSSVSLAPVKGNGLGVSPVYIILVAAVAASVVVAGLLVRSRRHPDQQFVRTGT